MDASAFSTCCLSIYIVAVYFRKYAFLLIRSGYTIDNRWLLAHTQMSTMWKLEEATGRMPRRKSQSDWDDGVEEVLSKKQNHTLSLSPC